MRDYYSGDPAWMTTRYPGKCKGCGKTITKGERAFRYKDGSLFCNDGCGQAESDTFEAAAQDEYAYTRGYGV